MEPDFHKIILFSFGFLKISLMTRVLKQDMFQTLMKDILRKQVVKKTLGR